MIINSLFLLAVLPAAVLLYYVWQKDPIEKEPPGLLLKLLVLGILSTIPAALIEMLFSYLFDTGGSYALGAATYRLDPSSQALAVLVVQYFVGVALVEEGCKFFFLKGQTWNNRAFDYVFDGIVYAVFVGLGFAIAENINYVFSYGFGTGVVRAFTAIPGHCVFGVFMGYFYGRAKHAQAHHRGIRAVFYGTCAIIVPLFCHGTYDSLASLESDEALGLFLVFLVAIVAIAMHLVKTASAKAERIY